VAVVVSEIYGTTEVQFSWKPRGLKGDLWLNSKSHIIITAPIKKCLTPKEVSIRWQNKTTVLSAVWYLAERQQRQWEVNTGSVAAALQGSPGTVILVNSSIQVWILSGSLFYFSLKFRLILPGLWPTVSLQWIMPRLSLNLFYFFLFLYYFLLTYVELRHEVHGK